MPKHPWQLTLRQFLERAQREYGVVLKTVRFPLLGPQGPVRFEYLEKTDASEAIALMLGIDPEDVLTPTVLRSLCRQLSLPPEDFHLDPEDPV